MHQNFVVSKDRNVDVSKNLASQKVQRDSKKHLDYKLKEKQADFIKCRLPNEFILVNVQNDELRKYEQEYKGNALKNGLFVSKPGIMQQKKNDMKNQAKEKGRINYDMSMQKIKQNGGLQKQGKAMGQQTWVKKPLRQGKAELENNGLISDTRVWGNESTLAEYQNSQKSHFYKQNKNFISQVQQQNNESQHMQAVLSNFSSMYSQGINDMQANHEMIPMEYPYLNNFHQNLHYYDSVYQIPFLQSGELRYNQKYFQPKEGQSVQKNHLFLLFGLPFNEKCIEAPKLNDVQKTFCLNFLQRLLLHESSSIFRSPVSPQLQRVPDYHYIVYQPMDLQTIHNKIINDAYREISQFHADINKIIVSSYKYNERGSPSFVATVQFEDYYFQVLKQVKRCPEDFVKELVSKKKGDRKEEKKTLYLTQVSQKSKGDNVSSTESNGRSEKNLKSTKVSRQKGYHEDDNSQVFYQEMISEPNYHEYQQENMMNHISAESQRKGNVMVHHRKIVKNSSNNSIASPEIYQPIHHQNNQSFNGNMKWSVEKKENKSMGRLFKKGSLQDSIIEETRKQIQKSNFSQNIPKSSLIKGQNEKLQQFLKDQQNQQRKEQQEELEILQHFKFDLDENVIQNKPVKETEKSIGHKSIQKHSLFRSEISLDKFDRFEEDPKQKKQNNINTNQFSANMPKISIARQSSRTHIPKEDEEQLEIPSKIQLFDCEPTLNKNADDQTKKTELSIPLEAIRMIEEMDKEQSQKQLKQITFPANTAIINKKSSKGELLEYIALLDTESSKYKNLQKESQAPQTNAPLHQTDSLHQTNLGNFDVDPSYRTTVPQITNEIPVKQKAKKKRRILKDEDSSDQSGYDEFLQKQLKKLDKSKRVQKMRSSQSYLRKSLELLGQKRKQKNTQRGEENVRKIGSLPNHQQMPVNVNQTMQNFYNLPSQISLQQPTNRLLVKSTKNNVESTWATHTSQSHNPKGVPVQHPKDLFIEKDQEKDNVEEPGIDFTDFFS